MPQLFLFALLLLGSVFRHTLHLFSEGRGTILINMQQWISKESIKEIYLYTYTYITFLYT